MLSISVVRKEYEEFEEYKEYKEYKMCEYKEHKYCLNMSFFLFDDKIYRTLRI